MTVPLPLPATHCPLCAQPNACAVAASGRFNVECWCTQAAFSADLLAQVPPQLRDKACICASCAAAPITKTATSR
ncbi:MAG: cysteine-rich CWC family protein [Burkholderiales bacterium]